MKDVCAIQNLDYPEDGPLDSGPTKLLEGLYDAMKFSAKDRDLAHAYA